MSRYIVLDSMTICGDYFLRSQFVRDLGIYVSHTKSSLVVPPIIRAEVVENYKRSYDVAISDLTTVSNQMNRLRRESLIDLEKAKAIASEDKAKYPTYLDAELKKLGIVDIGYQMPNQAFLIGRLTSRRRPFSAEGHGLGDTLLWYGTLHCVGNLGDTDIITADHAFYATKKSDTLHEDLNKDLEGLKHNCTAYRSIQHYLESNWPKPIGVDMSFLRELESLESVKAAVVSRLTEEMARIVDGFGSQVQLKISASRAELTNSYGYVDDGKVTLVLRFKVKQAFTLKKSELYYTIGIDSEGPRECISTVHAACHLTDKQLLLSDILRISIENPAVLEPPFQFIDFQPMQLHPLQPSGSMTHNWNRNYGFYHSSSPVDLAYESLQPFKFVDINTPQIVTFGEQNDEPEGKKD